MLVVFIKKRVKKIGAYFGDAYDEVVPFFDQQLHMVISRSPFDRLKYKGPGGAIAGRYEEQEEMG